MSEELVQNDEQQIEDTTNIEERKQQIKDGLISQDKDINNESVPQKEELENTSSYERPQSVSAKPDRDGMSMSGPSRKRIKGSSKKYNNKPTHSRRRGFQKIWSDKPVKTVGDGVNTTDISKRRK